MDAPIQVQGSIIEIYHYLLKYEETNDGVSLQKSEGFVTQEEAEQQKCFLETYEEEQLINGKIVKIPISYSNFSIEVLDTSSFKWLDGIDVGTQDNAMQKAIEIYNMGEQAYLDSKNAPSKMESLEKENRQLKARVSAQEENSKFLEDCLIEMASVVYS